MSDSDETVSDEERAEAEQLAALLDGKRPQASQDLAADGSVNAAFEAAALLRVSQQPELSPDRQAAILEELLTQRASKAKAESVPASWARWFSFAAPIAALGALVLWFSISGGREAAEQTLALDHAPSASEDPAQAQATEPQHRKAEVHKGTPSQIEISPPKRKPAALSFEEGSAPAEAIAAQAEPKKPNRSRGLAKRPASPSREREEQKLARADPPARSGAAPGAGVDPFGSRAPTPRTSRGPKTAPSPHEARPAALPVPNSALLELQAAALSGKDDPQFTIAMNAYRGKVLARLEAKHR